MTLLARFEAKISPEPTSGCWLWTGSVAGFGYGRIQRGPRGGGVVLAHRVSWELYRGPIPVGLCALHRCDQPACVNPDHLFLGTHADNTADKIAKGRLRYGAAPLEARAAQRRAQTHCKRGHELIGSNLIQATARCGYRGCKKCAVSRYNEVRS